MTLYFPPPGSFSRERLRGNSTESAAGEQPPIDRRHITSAEPAGSIYSARFFHRCRAVNTVQSLRAAPPGYNRLVMTAKEILDAAFLEMRWRCLSMAADLDRLERAAGGAELLKHDPRLQTLRKALDDGGVSVIACPVDYAENARLVERLGMLEEM